MAAEQQLLVFSGVNDFTPNTSSGRLRKVTLTFNGNSTSEIDLDTQTMATLQAAAEALAGIGAGNVTLTATTSSGYFAIQVDYAAGLGNVPQMTASMTCGFIDSDWGATITTEAAAEVMEYAGRPLIYWINPSESFDTTSDTLGGSATLDESGSAITDVTTPEGFSIYAGGIGLASVQFIESGYPTGVATPDVSGGAGYLSIDQTSDPYVPYSPGVSQVTLVTLPSNPTPVSGQWRPDSLGHGGDAYVSETGTAISNVCLDSPTCTTSGAGSHGSPYVHELTYSDFASHSLVLPAVNGDPNHPYAVVSATASTVIQGSSSIAPVAMHHYAMMRR